MKLYFVQGLRHSAVVMARTEKESIELVTKVNGGVEDDRVLFGSVGDWESPNAEELKLPKGWKIIQNKS